MYVIAFGNAFDGISLTGPFTTHDEALAFVEGAEGDWTITELSPPPDYTPKVSHNSWTVTFDPKEPDLYLTNDNCLGGIKIIQEYEGISVDFIDNQDATIGSSYETFKALNAGSEVA